MKTTAYLILIIHRRLHINPLIHHQHFLKAMVGFYHAK
jgi:hypothetical protein